jgi:hypothetical protein
MAINQASEPSPQPFKFSDRKQWAALLRNPRPVLTHLNADTTWLIQLPYPASATPPPGRTHFNILLDPWLQGPQSDVASWFSTQWHLVPPSVKTLAELNAALVELEGGESTGGSKTPGKVPAQSHVDIVVISHEFTDHCHRATLMELPTETPVFATEKAAELIRSWEYFDTVITTPGFSETTNWQSTLSIGPLPAWVGIGRVISPGNALYYHSAVLITFDLTSSSAISSNTSAETIIYSPHGIQGSDLACLKATRLRALALLHGLHDVQIWMTKQLNLGALNGIQAAAESGARYWIATHDEVKKGGGLIAPLLRRTQHTLKDAITAEEKRIGREVLGLDFVELGSGDGLALV